MLKVKFPLDITEPVWKKVAPELLFSIPIGYLRSQFEESFTHGWESRSGISTPQVSLLIYLYPNLKKTLLMCGKVTLEFPLIYRTLKS